MEVEGDGFTVPYDYDLNGTGCQIELDSKSIAYVVVLLGFRTNF